MLWVQVGLQQQIEEHIDNFQYNPYKQSIEWMNLFWLEFGFLSQEISNHHIRH